MKQKSLLLLATLLLTLACLGAPQPTEIAPNRQTAAPPTEALPSPTPQPTALPSYLARLKVAYILDGNVWLWDASAPARQLTSDGDARRVKVSSDGMALVYQRRGDNAWGPISAENPADSLWAVNSDGSNPRQLMDLLSYALPILPMRSESLELSIAQFEFQPGAHWIYFNTKWVGEEYSIASNDLHRVDADAPTPQTLLTSDGGNFTFSPDGNLLALSSLTDIKIIRADGSGLITALHYPKIFLMEGFNPQVVWMENNSGFYTVLPDNSGVSSKYLFVSADGSFSAQLSEFDSVPGMSAPMISPDGLKVAYVNQTAIDSEIGVVEASNINTIIASYQDPPMLFLWNWSPDSKRVVYSISHPVFVLSAGIGIPPSPLTESVSPYSLRWIDSEHFIFFREGKLLIGQIENPDVVIIASGFQKPFEFINSYDFVLLPAP